MESVGARACFICSSSSVLNVFLTTWIVVLYHLSCKIYDMYLAACSYQSKLQSSVPR